MSSRVYSESAKKWAKKSGITGISIIILYVLFSVATKGMVITDIRYSEICAGRDLNGDGDLKDIINDISEICWIEYGFYTLHDVFWQRTGYDPWGRNTSFDFNEALKNWKVYRDWGKGFRKIPIDEGCTGSWCGCYWCRKNKFAEYAIVWRGLKNYTLRIEAEKENAFQDVEVNFNPTIVWKGVKIDFELIDNTDYCFTDCHLRFRFKINKTLTVNKESDWTKKFIKKARARNLTLSGFRILKNVSYNVSVPDYGTCINYLEYDASNETCLDLGLSDYNSTYCLLQYDCQIGSHQETRYKKKYKDFNPLGKTIQAGKWYNVELWGKKHPMGGDIDAKPCFWGYCLPFAWWSDYSYMREIWGNTSSGTITMPVRINATIGTSDFLLGTDTTPQNAVCNYTLNTTWSGIGKLFYQDSTNYTCVNYAGDTEIPMDVDEGNSTDYSNPYDGNTLWIGHLNGTDLHDSSIYAEHGVNLSGTAVHDGQIGNGLYFDGTNDYFEVNNIYKTTTNSGAYSLWINKTSAATDDFVIDQYNNVNDYTTFLQIWGPSGAGTVYFFNKAGGNKWRCGVAAGSIVANTWNFIYAEWNTTDCRIWVNNTRNDVYINYYGTGGVGVNKLIRVGERNDGSGDFTGVIDELHFYNKTLSAAERTFLYESTKGSYNRTQLGAEESAPAANETYISQTVYSPTNTTYASTSISVNVTTNVNATINYSLNSAVNVTLCTNCTSNTTTITATEGSNKIIFTAINDTNSSDTDADTVYFTVDSAKPYAVVLDSPVDSATLYDTTVTFNFTAYDVTSKTMNCSLIVDSSINTYNATTCNATLTELFSSLSTGTHYWNISCNDTADNQNTSTTRSFEVENVSVGVCTYQNCSAGAVTIVWDDGRMGIFDTLYPLLQSRGEDGSKMSLAIPCGKEGSNFCQDSDFRDCMSTAQVQEMANFSFDLISHGTDHVNSEAALEGCAKTLDTNYFNHSMVVTCATPGGAPLDFATFDAPIHASRTASYVTSKLAMNPSTPYDWEEVYGVCTANWSVDADVLCDGKQCICTYENMTYHMDTLEDSGNWTVWYIHNINKTCDASGQHISEDMMNKTLNYIATKDLWFDDFSNQTRYIRARDNYTVTSEVKNSDYINFTVSHSLNGTLINFPITMNVTMSSSRISDISSVDVNGTSVTYYTGADSIIFDADMPQSDVSIYSPSLAVAATLYLNETNASVYYELGSIANITAVDSGNLCISLNLTGYENINCSTSPVEYMFTTIARKNKMNGSTSLNLTKDSTLDLGTNEEYTNVTFDVYGYIGNFYDHNFKQAGSDTVGIDYYDGHIYAIGAFGLVKVGDDFNMTTIFSAGVLSEPLFSDLFINKTTGDIHIAYRADAAHLYYRVYNETTKTWGSQETVANSTKIANVAIWNTVIVANDSHVPFVAFADTSSSNRCLYVSERNSTGDWINNNISDCGDTYYEGNVLSLDMYNSYPHLCGTYQTTKLGHYFQNGSGWNTKEVTTGLTNKNFKMCDLEETNNELFMVYINDSYDYVYLEKYDTTIDAWSENKTFDVNDTGVILYPTLSTYNDLMTIILFNRSEYSGGYSNYSISIINETSAGIWEGKTIYDKNTNDITSMAANAVPQGTYKTDGKYWTLITAGTLPSNYVHLFSNDESPYTENITVDWDNDGTYDLNYPGILIGDTFYVNNTNFGKKFNLTYTYAGTQYFDIVLPANVTCENYNITVRGYSYENNYNYEKDFLDVTTETTDRKVVGMGNCGELGDGVLTDDAYEKLWYHDSVLLNTKTKGGSGVYGCGGAIYAGSIQEFRYQVAEEPSHLVNITIFWDGTSYTWYGGNCGTADGAVKQLQIWNYTSNAWESMGTLSTNMSHIFTSGLDDIVKNNWLKYRGYVASWLMLRNCEHNYLKTDYTNISVFVNLSYPTNVSLDVGFDGDYEYINDGELNFTSVEFGNDSTRDEVQDQIDDASLNWLTLSTALKSSTPGIVEVLIANLTYNLSYDNYTAYGINVTNTNGTIALDVDVWGKLEISNIFADFLGDIDYNVSANGTWHYAHVRYSDYDADIIPKYDLFDYIYFVPRTNSSKNVKPEGQTTTYPAINVTGQAQTDNFDWYISVNRTEACLDQIASNTSTFTDYMTLNASMQKILHNCSSGINATCGSIWLYNNYTNCAGSYMYYEPYHLWEGKCISCL